MTTKLSEAFPPPGELLELEPEEIGIFLLNYLCSLDPLQAGKLNRHNLTGSYEIEEYAGPKTEAVEKAVSEAWAWLARECLIAPTPHTTGGDYVFVTRRGLALREKPDLDAFRKGYLLPRAVLDTSLHRNVYPLFIRGDYDTSVFRAYKEVEVKVRLKAGLPNELFGVNLMRAAFHPQTGKLSDMQTLASERQAVSDLFVGSIGLFKNPSSHRDVNFDDPAEVASIILFANYLLRLVDRCKV